MHTILCMYTQLSARPLQTSLKAKFFPPDVISFVLKSALLKADMQTKHALFISTTNTTEMPSLPPTIGYSTTWAGEGAAQNNQ